MAFIGGFPQFGFTPTPFYGGAFAGASAVGGNASAAAVSFASPQNFLQSSLNSSIALGGGWNGFVNGIPLGGTGMLNAGGFGVSNYLGGSTLGYGVGGPLQTGFAGFPVGAPGTPGFPPFLSGAFPEFGGTPGFPAFLGRPQAEFGGYPGLPAFLGQPQAELGGLPGLPPFLGQPQAAFGGGPASFPPSFGFL